MGDDERDACLLSVPNRFAAPVAKSGQVLEMREDLRDREEN